MRKPGILALIFAVLALVVSAASPDNRLAELEALVSSVQKELKTMKMQLDDGESQQEKSRA